MTEGAPIYRTDDRAAPSRERGGEAADSPLLSPLRELQLVDAFRAGDPEALSTLLRSYQRRMYGVCYRMLRRDEEARDVTQDAMIRVMEGLASFDGRAKLSTWIIRVTMNTCLSHLRKRRLRQHQSLDRPDPRSGPGGGGDDEGVSGAAIIEGREPAVGSRVEREETREAVQRALDGLDPAMRAVLVLRDMHDLDYQQVAEVLEVPVGTVKSRLFRARAALREAIEGSQV